MNEYELPISPNYVSNWGYVEAVRELLQNAIDADKNGYSKHIGYDSSVNIMYISNDGAKLPMSSLVLGCSSKTDDDNMIGKYGEGYKLALVVLLRNNIKVDIINNDEKWEVFFDDSAKFNTKVLKIKVIKLRESVGGVFFYINGIDSNMYKELLTNFPCIENNYGETISTDNGYILMDTNFSGKMFVEGLYIQSDNNFKYGYNFNSDVVALDRDRKAINYYELRQLTAASVVTAEKCSPQLFKAISDSYTDVREITEVLDEASDYFLNEYRDMFYETKKLEKNTLVATESVMKQLKQLDSETPVVKGTEIESYLIAKANDKLGLLYKAKERSETMENISNYWNDIEESNWFLFRCWLEQYSEFIPKEAMIEFEDILLNIRPYNYFRLDIPDDFIWTKENFEELKEQNENQT